MNSVAENDQAKQTSPAASDGRENSGPSVSKNMETVKRDSCQLPCLDISLLPPWEPMMPFPYQHRSQRASSVQHDYPPPASSNINVFKSPTAGVEKPACRHLTVFYAGKLHVYNVSADKAKAIMALASRSSGSPGSGWTPSSFVSPPLTPLNSVARPMDLPPITPSLSPAAILTHTHSSQTLKAEALPMAQKISILSFIGKRNERIHQKSPYARPAQTSWKC